MKTVRIVIIHVILFSVIVFLSFSSLYLYKTNAEVHKMMVSIDKNIDMTFLIKNSFISFGTFLLIIYSFYFLVFNFVFKKAVNLWTILYSLGIFLGLLTLLVLENSKNIGFTNLITNSLFILFFGGLGLGVRSIIEYLKTKEKQKELESKNLKIELNMLRSQINPHFLFNTLNNIDALIRKDPDRASELLIKLSQEMRYMLYDSNTEKISLASEVEFIKDYVSLQKLRIKNPDVIELNLTGNFENIMLPPMLLIPFIENAFKYCNKFDVEKAIGINLSVNNNVLIFESNNYYDPENKASNPRTGGIGLEVVEKRLDLLYPSRHEFTINKVNCQFIVSLKIQLDGN